jgi:hypothetical protein
VRSWTPELGLFSSPLSTSASILMEVGAGLLGGTGGGGRDPAHRPSSRRSSRRRRPGATPARPAAVFLAKTDGANEAKLSAAFSSYWDWFWEPD